MSGSRRSSRFTVKGALGTLDVNTIGLDLDATKQAKQQLKRTASSTSDARTRNVRRRRR